MTHEPPRMVVVAGPSGSGKSTFFAVSDFEAAYFNVDDRCAELNGGSAQRIPPEIRHRAQQECEAFIEACTRDGRSFAVESTLRSDVAIHQARRAKAAGFWTEMVFVATESVEENVLRVLRRALDGGHSAPEARLREIYRRSLENLVGAIAIFDRVILYDSTSSEQGPRRVAQFSSGKLAWRCEALPAWCSTGGLAVLLKL